MSILLIFSVARMARMAREAFVASGSVSVETSDWGVICQDFAAATVATKSWSR